MIQLTSRVKLVLTCYIKASSDVPMVQSTDMLFDPRKVEVCDFGTRCYVQVSGPGRNMQGRSKKFNVYGTQYPPTPEWLKEVIEMGYNSVRAPSVAQEVN